MTDPHNNSSSIGVSARPATEVSDMREAVKRIVEAPDESTTAELVAILGEKEVEIFGSNLSGENFSNDDLDGLIFSECQISDTTFSWSRLAGAKWVSCEGSNGSFARTTGALFMEKCSLGNFSFRSAELDSFTVKDCLFQECELLEMSIGSFEITASELFKCRFDGTKIRASRMTGGVFNNCSFANCSLESCSFVGISLNNVIFDGAKIEECDFSEINLFSCSFKNSNLTGSKFFKSIIKRESF